MDICLKWFKLERGCRQGDALSPYLFILCAEILAVLLRNNPRIKGIKINGIEYIVSQYADDTSLTLDGTSESLLNTMLVLKFYGRISGLNINTDKTKVVWFGSRKDSQEILCPEFNLSWDNNVFTLLGVKFSTNLREMVDVNYETKIEEIKNLFASWSKRIITPIGKIVVIKTLALAKLNHLILGIPNPSQEKINALQKIFYKFLWNNANDKVKRNIIIQDYYNGGLNMIDLKLFMDSLKATWFRRVLGMNNKFSKLVEFTCPGVKNIYKYGNDYIKTILNNNINPFWKDALNSYRIISHNIPVSTGNQCHSVNIWYNPDIKVGGSSVCYNRWLAGGVIFIGDLFNEDGDFYSYRQFNNIYSIRTNFLEYNGLISATRNFLRKKEIQNIPPKTFGPVMPLTLELICKDIKGCRRIYKQLLSTSETPTSLQKWIDDLANDAQILPTESIYDIPFKITKDPKLLWFQYRINHRILGTNYLLKKMNIVADDTCTFCNNAPETVKHLFWNCIVTRNFFNELFTHIQNKCNLHLSEWGVKEILFGNKKIDKVQNLLLLQAKHFLYFNKMKLQIPSFEVFKKQICSFYKIQKFIAIKNFQQSKFDKTWDKYKNLAQS